MSVVRCLFPRFGLPHLLRFTVRSSIAVGRVTAYGGTTGVSSGVWSPIMRASEHCFSYVCVGVVIL
jgi:hypothetical protein